MARKLNADVLMILTSVDQVSLNYKSANERMLGRITVEEAKQYMKEKQFEQGSMLPKFEAVVNFLETGKDRVAVITSVERAKAAYLEKSGTIIK